MLLDLAILNLYFPKQLHYIITSSFGILESGYKLPKKITPPPPFNSAFIIILMRLLELGPSTTLSTHTKISTLVQDLTTYMEMNSRSIVGGCNFVTWTNYELMELCVPLIVAFWIKMFIFELCVVVPCQWQSTFLFFLMFSYNFQ